MLVLSRKVGGRVHIGTGIILTVVGLRGTRARLGIEAPAGVVVLREEVRGRPRPGARPDAPGRGR